jgi:putative ABC transport system permease protein
MRIIDIIKTSQTNLVRSKLRTFLTVLAVFIGTFTISITNGVGSGVKAYVDQELGNVGVENAFIVQSAAGQSNPFGQEVVEYDPNQATGIFNQALLTDGDIDKIQAIKNVTRVTPDRMLQIDYVTAGSKKYQAFVSQYFEGFNLNMTAGRVLDVDQASEITIPIRYVVPLGFSSPEDALNKNLIVGYKNSRGVVVEKNLVIVGVGEESILGNSSIYISPPMQAEIGRDQTIGIPNVEGTYTAFLVEFDRNLPQSEIDSLQQVLFANQYTAQTIQDQIGTFSQVINGILVGLNIFGIIALLVAAFGIVNTLFMAVNERTSEIGLMKALGANSRTVFAIFSIEAASIGFWGALIGIGVSIAVGSILNVYASNNFLKDFPGFDLLAFPLLSSLVILLGIIILAFLAGTLPSLKASRLDPIKALRYE